MIYLLLYCAATSVFLWWAGRNCIEDEVDAQIQSLAPFPRLALRTLIFAAAPITVPIAVIWVSWATVSEWIGRRGEECHEAESEGHQSSDDGKSASMSDSARERSATTEHLAMELRVEITGDEPDSTEEFPVNHGTSASGDT